MSRIVETLPDSVTWERDGTPVQIVERVLIERPMSETEQQRKVREKRGEPVPMISYVQGRLQR